jgi:hypothetical protein
MSKRIRKNTLAALVVLVSGLGGLAAAAQTQDVPVITTIEDFEAAIAPTLQIQRDGFGDYQNSRDVQSVIQSGGDWVLATNTKFSTRGVKLDFSQPVAGSGPGGGAPIPLPTGTYKARLISKCHLYGNNLFDLAGGQMVPCPLTITFDLGSDGYRIQMNPVTGVYVYPETNFVNVTCTGTSPDTRCNQWKIEPSGAAADGSLRNRANLTKIVTSKGKTTESNQGDFYFSFLIRLAKQ